MNGVHDMGGLQGFGPIDREAQEPVFHADWEKRVFALFFGGFAGGFYNIDMFRAEIERMPGHEYLRSSYYEHWLHAIEALLIQGGAVTHAELQARIAELQAAGRKEPALMPALPLEMVAPLLATGASTRMPNTEPARFKPGDAVIARNIHPVNHTRLPRYVRGKRGTVRADNGTFSFNDTVAHGLGHQPQHVYSVRFSAQELWGPDASPLDSVYIDLFDRYLDPAP